MRLSFARRLFAVLLVGFSFAATSAQQKQHDIKLTIEGRPEHPIVYMTKADIARARVNREKFDWAKKAAATLIKEADEWAKKSDDELVKLIPPPNACYAYGFSGCPVCGGTLASWWGQGGVASLDDPGHIKCVNGHRLPDEKHPDTGEGWTDEHGKKFYFVGTYHSYVIDTLTTATTKLVHAYALTGEEKYAAKGALILDHLARIYPTSETGSWDYPSHPPSGRFNRPWYQVARTLIAYANQYDILLMGKALEEPSSATEIVDSSPSPQPSPEGRGSKELTRRENIEKNMLLNGAAYCYRESLKHPSLNNGQADYMRGPMAVAAAMGIPQYVAWGVDGPYSIGAMIANNVDRDGQYYETSALYSDHARYLYMDIAEILANYTDAAHPDGIKLASDPVFRMFNLLPRTRLRCANHSPNLGDDAPNVNRVATTQATDSRDLVVLEHLCALARDAELDKTLADACGGEVAAARAASRAGEWLLFHAGEPAKGEAAAATPQQPTLFSQKGLAILRSGARQDARAVSLRFGPTLNHGHLDEMNLNIYARGYEMSYDLGYSLGSTHTQVGWAKQTASHNTVLVDETPQLQGPGAGGSVEMFAQLAGVSVVSANNPACYTSQKVEQYSRTVAMIDVSPQLSYVVDIFRVRGGKQHDYIFHARGTDVKVEGVELSEPAKGSLAGAEVNWGDRIGGDGNVIDVVDKEYWNPPPGNGLGFLMHPRSGKTSGNWSATWTIDQDATLRLNMLARPDANVILCDANGIYPKFPRSAYVINRAAGPSNEFVAVIEPFGDERAIKSVERSDHNGEIVITIGLADGRRDHVFCSESNFTHVRYDAGGPVAVNVVGAKEFKCSELVIKLPELPPATISRVDYEKNILFTDAKLDPLPLAGQWIHVRNPKYTKPSGYRIASVAATETGSAIHLEPTRLILGRAHMDAAPKGKVLPNVVPLDYAKSVTRKPTGFFAGKRIATPSGKAQSTIDAVAGDGLNITVADPAGFRAGDDLIIYDVSAGDTLEVPPWATATREASGEFKIQSNVAGVSITIDK